MPIPEPGEVGVQFVPPPPSIRPQVEGQIAAALASFKGEGLAVVAVADRQGGWNSALVMRGPHGIDVQTWIGKSWGEGSELDWGVKVQWTVNFNK